MKRERERFVPGEIFDGDKKKNHNENVVFGEIPDSQQKINCEYALNGTISTSWNGV